MANLVPLTWPARGMTMVDATELVAFSHHRVDWYGIDGELHRTVEMPLYGVVAGKVGSTTITAVRDSQGVSIFSGTGLPTLVPGRFASMQCSGGLLWLLDLEPSGQPEYNVTVIRDLDPPYPVRAVEGFRDIVGVEASHPRLWPIHREGLCGITLGGRSGTVNVIAGLSGDTVSCRVAPPQSETFSPNLYELTGEPSYLSLTTSGASNDDGTHFLTVEQDTEILCERAVDTGAATWRQATAELPSVRGFYPTVGYSQRGTRIYAQVSPFDIVWMDRASRSIVGRVSAPDGNSFEVVRRAAGSSDLHAMVGIWGGPVALWLSFDDQG